MQALLDLMSIIGNPTQGSVRALANAAGAEDDPAAAVDGFISLLEQRLGELAQDDPEAANLNLEDFELDADLLAENPAALEETGLADLLRSMSARAEISDQPILIGPRTAPSPVAFNNLLEAIGQEPIDLSDLDAGMLKLIDLPQLTADLERLKQLFAAVTTEQGEALSEEELLAILQSDLSESVETGVFTAGLDNADAAPSGDDDDLPSDQEASLPTLSQTLASARSRDDVDADLVLQRQQRAEERLLDRLEARDARIAATEDAGDGDAEDGVDLAAVPSSLTGAASNATAANSVGNVASGTQLAALNAPGNGQSQSGTSNGQTGGGNNGFGRLFADDASQTTPHLAHQTSSANTNFQAVMASHNAARAPMNPATMQVNLTVRNAVAQGQTQLQIQLKPASLGMVDVKLAFDSDGAVRGTLIVDRPETLEMLRNDSRTLERALQDAGVNLENGGLEFSLRDGGDAQSKEQDKAGNNARGSGDDLAGLEADDDTRILDQTMDIITDDQVDVRV